MSPAVVHHHHRIRRRFQQTAIAALHLRQVFVRRLACIKIALHAPAGSGGNQKTQKRPNDQNDLGFGEASLGIHVAQHQQPPLFVLHIADGRLEAVHELAADAGSKGVLRRRHASGAAQADDRFRALDLLRAQRLELGNPSLLVGVILRQADERPFGPRPCSGGWHDRM